MATATLLISAIGSQAANTPFAVTGTYSLDAGSWQEQLEFSDAAPGSAGASTLTPIAAAATSTTVSSFTFTHPGLAAGTHTISVKDPLTGTIVTSNSFTVGVAKVITPAAPSGLVAGATWTFTGTLTGYSAAPSLTYRLDGGTATAVTGVTATGWSMSMGALAAGTHTIVVSDGTVSSSTVSFTVTAVPKVISPAVPANVVSGAVFQFTGSLSGYTTAPALTYTLDNASVTTAITGVTVNGWSMALTAPSAGTHTLSVSDGTTTVGVSFTVAAPAKTLTAYAPPSTPAGNTFTFTGVLTNFSTIPALTYNMDGGAETALTGVTVNGWAISLTAPAIGNHTIRVTDAADSLSSTVSYTTTTSAGATPVTWSAATASGGMALSNSNYTATATGSATPYGAPQWVLATAPIATTVPTGTVIVWEIAATTLTQNWCVGVADAAITSGGLGSDANAIGFYPSTGTGSQPPQTVYFGANQLGADGTASANGDIITVAVNGNNIYFSDTQMRTTSGVLWNGTTLADPVSNLGGFPFTIASPFYPAFGEAEAGGIAVLNDGTSAFSTFLANYIALHSTKIVTLSGQITQATKSISPATPVGLVLGAAFNFTGALTGYTSAPSLTYMLDGAAAAPLTGVTATNWSMTLTISTTGSHTIKVTDGTVSGSTTFTVTAGGITRVVAPLSGTITPGTWTQNVRLTVAAMPNGFMQADILLPANYNTGVVYPLIIDGHENDEGMNGNTYPSSDISTNGGEVAAGISVDSVYNTVYFRTNFPAIVIALYCDQSIDTSGANGNANFGGYNDTPNSGGNEQGMLAWINHAIATWAVDTTRIYGAGRSLGAIGVLAWLVDNNAYNGINKIFAAGLGYSDQLYRPSVNGGSNTAAITSMKSVPYLAISTPYDNNPAIYDQAAWTQWTGNTNFPSEASYAAGGVAALQAAGTSFYYMAMTSGTMPWQTYSQTNADGGKGTAIYNWLFAQTAGGLSSTITITGVTITNATGSSNAPIGTSVGTLGATASGGSLTTPTFSVASQSTYTASGNNAIVTTVGPAIVDSSGNAWTITSGAQLAYNGVAYTPSAGVVELAYVSSTVWQQNSSGNWYSMGPGPTTVSGPTTTSPLTGAGVPVTPTASSAFKIVGSTLQFAQSTVGAGIYIVNVQVVAGNASNSPQTYPVVVTVHTATSNFYVSGGVLYDPDGNVWLGGGVNIGDSDMVNEVTATDGSGPMLDYFPNMNIVRVACYDLTQPASYYASFITALTARKIVVLLEDHTSSDGLNSGGGTGVVFTGTLLTNELAWYTRIATAFGNNPYVWFATDNEPSVSPSVAALSTWHQQTYNAIRATGAKNILMIDVGNPYTTGLGNGMTASVYAAMTNVIWDMHCYDWLWSDPGTNNAGYSANLAVIQPQLAANIAQLQQIPSGDGTMPVIIGEYGNSTIGTNVDAGGAQNNQAVQLSVGASGGSVGCMAWFWGGYNPPGQPIKEADNLGGPGVTTAYGTQVAGWIATANITPHT